MRLVHSHPWPVKQSRFHGRVEADDRECEAVGCEEPGEFRAPGDRGAGFDGPGQWRWFCLDHVRLFNSSYNWFAGMSADEIVAAVERHLGIKTGESTPDGRIYLKREEECLAACNNAPMMMVDHVYHENLTPESAVKVLDGVK